MILYFSGTGNSEYAALRIAEKLNDKSVNLFNKIRNRDYKEISSETPWVIAAPTYAWRLPHIVSDWLERTELTGNKDIYYVLTCGGSIGNAAEYLKKLSEKKNLRFMGASEIVMPENYIALFNTPTRDEAIKTIRAAESVIDETAEKIKSGEAIKSRPISLGDRLNSGIVNSLFYPIFVHAKKFYATDACISCGKCAKLCPLNNIAIKDGLPVWGDECTHCMACICKCPTEAIEYGEHSKGLPRYVCPAECGDKSEK